MADQIRVPHIQPNPVRKKDAGLFEVGFNLILASLAFHFPFYSVDLTQPPKKPVYVQVDPVPNNLILGIPTAAKPFFAVDLTQVSKKPVYVQQEQIINELPAGIKGTSVTRNPYIVGYNPRLKYDQISQISSTTLPSIVLPAKPLFAVDLTQVSPRKIYNQIDPVPNLLFAGLVSPVKPFFAVETTLTPRRPIYDQITNPQAQVLSTLKLTSIHRNPTIIENRRLPPPAWNLFPGRIAAPTGATGPTPFLPYDSGTFPVRNPHPVSGAAYASQRFAPIITAPPPFFQNEHPNPLPRVNDLAAHALTLSPIFGFKPFNLTDQPNPSRRPIYYQQPESGPNYLPIGLPRRPPVQNTDFPNPPRRPISYQDQNLPIPLLLGIGKLTPPFFLNDQPNPSRRPISYQDQNEAAPINLGLPKPAAPFFQNDQPNPSRRPISYPDQNSPFPSILGLPTPTPPFIQSVIDSNPVQGRERQQPELVPNLLTFTLIIPPAPFPFNQYEWPTPPRIKNANNFGVWDFGSALYTLHGNWRDVVDGQGSPWTLVNTGTINPWTPVPDGNTAGWSDVDINRTSPIIGGVT